MRISLVLVVALVLAIDGPTHVVSRSLIGPSNPTFDNDYYALDNMAWSRPNRFFNTDYQPLIRTNDEDDDISEIKRRYRPSTYKRRYRPSELDLSKRRYRPAELDLSNLDIKRAMRGLWSPAQLVGKVNGRQVNSIRSSAY